MNKINFPILFASFILAVTLWFSQIEPDTGAVPISVQLIYPDSELDSNLIKVEYADKMTVTVTGPRDTLKGLTNVQGYVYLTNARSGSTANFEVDIPELKKYLQGDPPQTKVKVEQRKRKVVPVAINGIGNLTDQDLRLEDPRPSPSEVTISGAASLVDQVVSVQGTLDLAAISTEDTKDVHIDLQAFDENGLTVVPKKPGTLIIRPERVDVHPVLVPAPSQKVVVISPAITGSPAAGVALVGYTVLPSQITLRGPSLQLARLSQVSTSTIDISKLTATKRFTVPLTVPKGTEVVGKVNTVTVEVQIKSMAPAGPSGATPPTQ